jgi:23S rRNA pseudouridine2605 synthase
MASRARARALILDGRVRVAGRVVIDPSAGVIPERGDIVIEGLGSARRKRWRTILFHKPRGVVTSRRDPEGRRTVFDLLGSEAGSLIAVGRLDMATTGLLLLTTDTRLADRLTDPINAIVRRYAVTVRGSFSDSSAARLIGGLGGMRARSVLVRKRSGRETHLIVELTEGRNREIRRLCAAVGHEVTRLKRIAFGGLELGDLQPGEWRDVTRDEIAAQGW